MASRDGVCNSKEGSCYLDSTHNTTQIFRLKYSKKSEKIPALLCLQRDKRFSFRKTKHFCLSYRICKYAPVLYCLYRLKALEIMKQQQGKHKGTGRSVCSGRQHTALISHTLVFEPDFPHENTFVALATHQILLLSWDKRVLRLFQAELTPQAAKECCLHLLEQDLYCQF